MKCQRRKDKFVGHSVSSSVSTLPLRPSTHGCFLTWVQTKGFSIKTSCASWEEETNLVKPDPLIFVVIQQLLQQRPALARDLESGNCTNMNLKFWNISSKDINMNDKNSVVSRTSTCFWCLGCKPMMMSSSPLKGTSPPTCSSNKICIIDGAQQFRSPEAELRTWVSLVKRQCCPCCN